ncbi:RUN domain-containing protein 3B-like [Oscarella lobularis]|uniref:RUN domain-containing protein 3B-like n=1 Tax=Oscarella lobularis TaxID=121494 RepID=UPI0033137AB2
MILTRARLCQMVTPLQAGGMEDQTSVAWELHARRQAEIHRGNLLAVLNHSVKSLIDQSCFAPIDDTSDALHNFCAVFEQVLSHRLKPQMTFFGGAEMPTFWDVVKTACKKAVPHNCLASIESMENVQTPLGKGRAWIRLAAMEKRLSEYLSAILANQKLLKEYYEPHAVLRSDEGSTVAMFIQGLNAVDFSLCLRDGSYDVGNYMAIDYTPFLSFSQSEAGRVADAVEERVAAMESGGHPVSQADIALHLQRTRSFSNGGLEIDSRIVELETALRKEREQKSFFEELLRNRESQLDSYKKRVTELNEKLTSLQNEASSEREQLHTIVIELQEKLGTSHPKSSQFLSSQNLKYQVDAQHAVTPVGSPSSSDGSAEGFWKKEKKKKREKESTSGSS